MSSLRYSSGIYMHGAHCMYMQLPLRSLVTRYQQLKQDGKLGIGGSHIHTVKYFKNIHVDAWNSKNPPSMVHIYMYKQYMIP